MKANWQTKKLGEVCEVIGGGTPSKANSKYYNGDILWATVRDLKYDVVEETEHKITKDAVKNSSTNIIPKGNVIIATRVGLGKVCIIKHDTAINQDLRGIVPNNLSELTVGYLFQWLKSVSHLIEQEGTGATVQGVKLSFIKSLTIPLPPLPEQKRIVEILDAVFNNVAKAKENAEKNLKNARELFDSTLQNIFANPGPDWEEKTLGEVCITGSGGTPLKAHKEYYENGTIPWLLSGEVYQGKINNAKNFITEKGLANSSARLFPPNTVLVAMYGATAGQVGILKFEASTNQAVCGILPNNNFIPEFLYYCFLSKKNELINKAVGGAQPNISQIKIKNTYIPIPPLPEQKRIVAKLDALSKQTRKLEDIYQKKLDALEELKKSVLQKAFNGELT